MGGNFLNSSIGKTFAACQFNNIDPHWFFFQTSLEQPTPDDPSYYLNYHFAVTE